MKHHVNIVVNLKGLSQARKEIQSLIGKEAPEQMKKFNKQTSRANRQFKEMPRRTRKASGGLKAFTGTIFSSLAVIGLFNRGLTTSLDAFKQFGELERAQKAFQNTVGGLNETLPILRQATRGTVEDFKLLKTATRAVTEGLGKEGLQNVFEQATAASRKLSLSTEDTISTVSKAITRLDKSALKTLGIVLQTNESYLLQQSLLGKVGGAASSVMQMEARRAFVLEELAKKHGSFNSIQADSLELMEQAKTSFRNLRASIGGVIGIALKPLIIIFTRVTNVTRDFLELIHKNPALKGFLQNLTMIAGVLGTIAASVGTFKLLGFLLGGLGSPLGVLGVSLFSVATAFSMASVGMEGFTDMIDKAATGAKVFFQLLNNYNPNDGWSRVLKKDKEALGGMYGLVVNLAKGFKVVESVFKGLMQGIGTALKTMGGALGQMGGAIGEMINAFEKGDPIKQSTLDKLEDGAALIGKWGAYLLAFNMTLGKVGSFFIGLPNLIKKAGTAIATFFTAKFSGVISLLGKLSTFLPLIAKITGITAGAGAVGLGALELGKATMDEGFSNPTGRQTVTPNRVISPDSDPVTPSPQSLNNAEPMEDLSTKQLKQMTDVLYELLGMEKTKDIKRTQQRAEDQAQNQSFQTFGIPTGE